MYISEYQNPFLLEPHSQFRGVVVLSGDRAQHNLLRQKRLD